MSTRILIVDDDANLRESIRDNLELDDYDCTEAGSGAEAMQQVVTGSFDVILMDYNLPDKTGIEVIHDIRKVHSEGEILMLTAHASLDTAVQAIQEAVYDFLVKPVDFDKLKRSIQKATERLRLNRENKRLIGDLQKANEQLLYLSNMKSKFLSMASHDLSNSLMTLQVSFEMLTMSFKPDEEQKKRLHYISSGLAQLSRLIEDLVDWASIEQGKFRLEPEEQTAADIIDASVGGVAVRAKQRGITVEGSAAKGLPKLFVDKKRLVQVLCNLLENALRHSAKGGTVMVSAEKNGEAIEAVRFSVKDTGEGIEPSEVKKIFESFYQPATPGGARGRLGLGLSISQEIVQSHGGKIWVDSDGKGKGATFFFTVPAKESAPGEPAAGK